MGRNNEKNIKIHNDKLHKKQSKVKNSKIERAEKLKEILKKFNSENQINNLFNKKIPSKNRQDFNYY